MILGPEDQEASVQGIFWSHYHSYPRSMSPRHRSFLTLGAIFALSFSAVSLIMYISIIKKSTDDLLSLAAGNRPQVRHVRINEEDSILFKAFNTTNPHSQSWCKFATCNNSPLCSPCNKRFLFIVATGRSGSTSLLKMLNHLPNVRLSGENNGELFVASRLISNLKYPSKKGSILDDKEQVDGPWMHNIIPTQSMACPLQQIVSTLNPPPTEVLQAVNQTGRESYEQHEESFIIGMKTIRIQNKQWGPFQAAEFFRQNFPCSRVIVNYRSDIDIQVESRRGVGWGNGNGGVIRSSIEKENDFLSQFASELGPDMAHVLDMTKWTNDIGILNELLEWLGFEGCNFQSTLHDNNGGYRIDRSKVNLGAYCHYPRAPEIAATIHA